MQTHRVERQPSQSSLAGFDLRCFLFGENASEEPSPRDSHESHDAMWHATMSQRVYQSSNKDGSIRYTVVLLFLGNSTVFLRGAGSCALMTD